MHKCLNVPKIISYNERTKTMKTVCVGTSNVSDFYGEENHNVPTRIFNKVREVIQLLYDCGVVYPDITGYNFIETPGKKKNFGYSISNTLNIYQKPLTGLLKSFFQS